MMYKSRCKYLVATVSVVMLSACSGGGTTQKDVTVEIVSDADAVAYETGDGVWKSDLVAEKSQGGTEKHYRLKHHGRYGVALYCGSGNEKQTLLFQLDTAESKRIVAFCGTQQGSSPISGTINDTTSIASTITEYGLAMGRDWQILSSSSTSYSLDVHHGKRDLVVTSLITQNSLSTPKRFYIERNLDVSGPVAGKTISLKDNNTHEIKTYDLQVKSGKGYVFLLSKNDTLFRANIDDKWFVPKSGLISKDVYLFYGDETKQQTACLQIYSADTVREVNPVIDPAHVAPLKGIQYDKSGKISKLHYESSENRLPHQFYTIKLTKNQTSYTIILGSKWLGNVSEYDLPDLSEAEGFANVWDGSDATTVSAEVTLSNISIESMFEAKRHYQPSNYFFPVVAGAIFQTAFAQIVP